MTRYYCNQHIPSGIDLTWVGTGNFTGANHLDYWASHTGSKSTKPLNGKFAFSDDLDEYQAYMRSFARPDFVRVDASGRLDAAFNVYVRPVGEMERHGVRTCTTFTGHAYQFQYPAVTHGAPFQHTGANAIQCAACGLGLDCVSGRYW